MRERKVSRVRKGKSSASRGSKHRTLIKTKKGSGVKYKWKKRTFRPPIPGSDDEDF